MPVSSVPKKHTVSKDFLSTCAKASPSCSHSSPPHRADGRIRATWPLGLGFMCWLEFLSKFYSNIMKYMGRHC